MSNDDWAVKSHRKHALRKKFNTNKKWKGDRDGVSH